MIEYPITKDHLRNQVVVQRRRGRPCKFGRGLRAITVPVSAVTVLALEMLSADSPEFPADDRITGRSLDYARDVIEQFAMDRFQERFAITPAEFLRRLEAAAKVLDRDRAAARVLAGARDGKLQ